MRLLQVGDRVRFEDTEHRVAAVSGTWVRLVDPQGNASAVLLAHLVDSPGFSLVGGDGNEASTGGSLPQSLDDVPTELAEEARAWERHIREVETGLAPDAERGATPRPEYDPSQRTVREREAAKAAELTRSGTPTSVRTVQRMRTRYRAGGVRDLVDGRSQRRTSLQGRSDSRVVEAIREVLAEETAQSTGTRDRLRHRVAQRLEERHGEAVVQMPSIATFNRLVAKLSAGQHTFGSAVTRRSAANRPAGPFTATWASRPGQQVQIDSTPLDVLAAFDDGQARRVELTAAVDIATRTICAAVLRPAGTKAVDASLLLARMLVPEPMRPGWDEALRMAYSRLPHRRLVDIDARMEHAAAKPVVVPETIACDRGKIYLSENFLNSCQSLGISVQPAHPQTPTDKSVIERTFGSINTLFCQYVAGYVGSDPTGRGAPIEAHWSLSQLQDLLDEWIITGWQQRPHDALSSPDTGRTLSPNEMYAVQVSAAGYVPVMLSGDNYIDLLPSCWRTINDYGIRIDGRTYDAKALNPYRRQDSGVTAQRGRWEVHVDPYDLNQVWVRNHHHGGWMRATWTHAAMVTAPFADFTWRHAQQRAEPHGGEPDETATARALAGLLDRVGQGPQKAADSKTDRRVAALTRAATETYRPALDDAPDEAVGQDEHENEDAAQQDDGTVIPFGIFDARAEAQRWP